MHVQVTRGSSGLVTTTLAKSLAILQTAMKQREPAATLLASEHPAQLSRPAPSNGTLSAYSASLAIAGCQAMLRTAKQESPQGSWSSISMDNLSSSRSPSQPDAGDSTIVCGTAYQPRMLPFQNPNPPSEPTLYIGAMPGDWAITGGLGSIGLLVAEWVAASSQSGSLWLLSRTAHSAAAAHMTQHPTAHFTIHQCDIASAEDSSGWGQSQRQGGSNPLGGLLHAGGVLRDALLPQQSPRGIREVAAGKVHGGLRLCSAAGLAPLAATVLFSSTAAVLGPPGQANYAAANAMLNHLSGTQNQSGVWNCGPEVLSGRRLSVEIPPSSCAHMYSACGYRDWWSQIHKCCLSVHFITF